MKQAYEHTGLVCAGVIVVITTFSGPMKPSMHKPRKSVTIGFPKRYAVRSGLFRHRGITGTAAAAGFC